MQLHTSLIICLTCLGILISSKVYTQKTFEQKEKITIISKTTSAQGLQIKIYTKYIERYIFDQLAFYDFERNEMLYPSGKTLIVELSQSIDGYQLTYKKIWTERVDLGLQVINPLPKDVHEVLNEVRAEKEFYVTIGNQYNKIDLAKTQKSHIAIFLKNIQSIQNTLLKNKTIE